MKYIINQFGNIIGIENEQGQTFMKEEEQIKNNVHNTIEEFELIVEQAKEMEKEQKGYSEEDMKQFAEWLIKINFNYTSNISDIFLVWKEQFKKK
jgi:cytochrome c553